MVREHETGDGTLILLLPRRNSIGYRILSKMFFIPREKKVSLDEIGRWVWRRCDGQTTVGQLVRQLSEEFQLSRKEAEISLMGFLKRLATKKLIGFALKQ